MDKSDDIMYLRHVNFVQGDTICSFSTRLRSNGKHMNMTRKLSLEAAQQILDPRSLPLSHGANYVHLVASIDGLTEEVLALDPARQPAILAPDMVGVSQTRAGSAHLR